MFVTNGTSVTQNAAQWRQTTFATVFWTTNTERV